MASKKKIWPTTPELFEREVKEEYRRKLTECKPSKRTYGRDVENYNFFALSEIRNAVVKEETGFYWRDY